MLLLAPVAALGAIGVAVVPMSRGWRVALLTVSVVWGAALAVVTELLSLFRGLSPLPVSLAWLAVAASAALIAWRTRSRWKWPPPKSPGVLPRGEQGLAVGLAALAVLIGIDALIAAPNTWDSMTYHMSRVVHWLQARSVSNYPTQIQPQLYQPPWAEFAILHTYVLSGSDQFANLIQWLAMLGTAVGVSLVARSLGAGPRTQLLAAGIALTLPTGVLEGSSTQNDYVLTFWLVALTAFLLQLRSGEQLRTQLLTWAVAGASLGLALLTKGTAYIYAAPFVLWTVGLARRLPCRQAIAALVLFAAAAAVPNAGYYARNVDLYGSPLGPGREIDNPQFQYANAAFSPPLWLSNTVKNVALELGTPFPAVNVAIEAAVGALHRAIGVDLEDPRIKFGAATFRLLKLHPHEDETANPLHLVLLVAALGLFVTSPRLRKQATLRMYAVTVIAAFLLFTLLLRWQFNNSRLHLPLFALWSPLVAVVLVDRLSPRAAFAVVSVLLVAAIPWAVLNQTRPLVGPRSVFALSRAEQYFQNLPRARDDYQQAVDLLSARRCMTIGLISGPNDLEYPLWALMARRVGRLPRLEHLEVRNVSARLAGAAGERSLRPCAIVALENADVASPPRVDGRSFGPALSTRSLRVYLPQS